MDTRLEQILLLESVNTDRIHLFLLPSEEWAAYEQSAVNLQALVPEVRETLNEETFPEEEIWLRRVLLSEELTLKYSLPLLCTLLDDDYIELSPQQQVCQAD